MEHASTVDIGARKRRTGGINEDSVATTVLENHHRQTSRPVGVFVLADGVGGEASGDVASFLATTVVRQRLTEILLGSGTDVLERFGVDAYEGRPPTAEESVGATLSAGRIRTAIQEAIDAAHQHVQEYASETGGRPATTLVACVYVDGQLHYGWVGDSRVYLINESHGEIQQLTRDHAVTNDLLDKGEIDDEVYARVHGDATAITNAVGGSPHGRPTVDVEFGSTDLYRDDILMLTSDGLIDAYPDIQPLRQEYQQADDTDAVREEILDSLVTDDEIRDIVLEAEDLHDAVERLISFANERGGKDNLSITLARDPAVDSTPDRLPVRGAGADTDGLIGQETMIETPDDDDRSADGGDATVDSGGSAELSQAGGTGGEETAAITILGTGKIYEIADGVTVGRDAGPAEDGPNIGLVVDGDVEPNHARLERDGSGNWRVRDESAAGTYVEGDEEWIRLCCGEDDGVSGEAPETLPLEDGTAFTLTDPREAEPIFFRFFRSVDRAQNRGESEPTEGGFLDWYSS